MVARVANRIHDELKTPFSLGGNEVFTSTSVGITLSLHHHDRPEEWLRDADTAMYRAKALGKAQNAIFDRSMHEHAVALLQLETDLRRAVERGEFLVHYQSIVSLSTGRITRFEALRCWQDNSHADSPLTVSVSHRCMAVARAGPHSHGPDAPARMARTMQEPPCENRRLRSEPSRLGNGATLSLQEDMMRRVMLVSALLAGVLAFGPMPASAGVSAQVDARFGRHAPIVYADGPRGYVQGRDVIVAENAQCGDNGAGYGGYGARYDMRGEMQWDAHEPWARMHRRGRHGQGGSWSGRGNDGNDN